MKISQFYPLIQVTDVSATADFYCKHFDFEPAFDSDWYVHLQSKGTPTTNLAVLDAWHDTIPTAGQGVTKGMMISFEVDNVDNVHEKCIANGMEIVQPLRDEPHGQRHFIGIDPNGIMPDVITPIPPSAEFLAQYREDAVPT